MVEFEGVTPSLVLPFLRLFSESSFHSLFRLCHCGRSQKLRFYDHDFLDLDSRPDRFKRQF